MELGQFIDFRTERKFRVHLVQVSDIMATELRNLLKSPQSAPSCRAKPGTWLSDAVPRSPSFHWGHLVQDYLPSGKDT